MLWNYIQPVEIRFGSNRLNEIKEIIEEAGYKKGLIIASKSVVKSGVINRLINSCDEVLGTVFTDFSPNPDVSEVDKCVEIAKKENVDFIVAIGGGSALDHAKAVSVMCVNEGSIEQYHGTGVPVPNVHLPLIAVPTTAGTGSEVTSVSVLTNRKKGKKAPIVSNAFYPKIAIIDPELTVSVPAKVTAATGIDVLSHAIEGYWSKGHQPICDSNAIHAIKLVFKYLYQAYIEPDNIVAREKMCEASLIAGLAFSLPKTTSSHACSFVLTNVYGIPHGEACGLTLDYFIKLNGDCGCERVDELAKNVGFSNYIELANAVTDLKQKMNLRCDMKDFNLTDEQVDDLVRISRHPNLYNNPVEITDEMLYEMYNSMR